MNKTINFIGWAHNMENPTLEWFKELYGENLGRHFFNKWQSHMHYSETTTECMLMRFFLQMSESHQETLINWVSTNYKFK